MKEKKLYRITLVRGTDCGGETISTISCRCCHFHEIEKEVQDLNDFFPLYQEKSNNEDYWNYYDFEELVIEEKGCLGENHLLPSYNFERNKLSLRNYLSLKKDGVNYLDLNFANKKRNNHQRKSDEMLIEEILNAHQRFLVGDFKKSDLIDLIKELNNSGIIKTNITDLGF